MSAGALILMAVAVLTLAPLLGLWLERSVQSEAERDRARSHEALKEADKIARRSESRPGSELGLFHVKRTKDGGRLWTRRKL